jgi:hypothetical protein
MESHQSKDRWLFHWRFRWQLLAVTKQPEGPAANRAASPSSQPLCNAGHMMSCRSKASKDDRDDGVDGPRRNFHQAKEPISLMG